VELNHDWDPAMNAPADVLHGGRRLAVKYVERLLRVKPHELCVRLAEPVRVVLMPRSVGEHVLDTVDTFLARPFGMPGGDDRHVVARAYEPTSEVVRVILHASDAVLRNDKRDDADPHRPTSIGFRTSDVLNATRGRIEIIKGADPMTSASSVSVRMDVLCAA
jgi:hypothetical protein